MSPRQPPRLGIAALSARQLEVLRLAAQDRSRKEIAHALGVSVFTVDAHLAAGCRALGVRSVAAATYRLVLEEAG